MPAKFRELRGLRENELTDTRTRSRAHPDGGATFVTGVNDEPTSSSESDAESEHDICSSLKGTEAAVAGALDREKSAYAKLQGYDVSFLCITELRWAGQPSQRAAQTLDDSPGHSGLEASQPRDCLQHRSVLETVGESGARTQLLGRGVFLQCNNTIHPGLCTSFTTFSSSEC